MASWMIVSLLLVCSDSFGGAEFLPRWSHRLFYGTWKRKMYYSFYIVMGITHKKYLYLALVVRYLKPCTQYLLVELLRRATEYRDRFSKHTLKVARFLGEIPEVIGSGFLKKNTKELQECSFFGF